MKITRREHVSDSELEEFIADPVLRQLLARRGVLTRADCECELGGLLHYDGLKNIARAAELIASAVEKQEHILIAGDYDVDGMTGTALGLRALRLLGADAVSTYIPSRYEGGYGLSVEAIRTAIDEQGVGFIITVDNGISCMESIAYAKSRGLTVVVTDHHETQEVLPPADVIVDPKQPGDGFASKNLCGAGVLFYVLCAVRSELIRRGFYREPPQSLSRYLDLVALGTIGDVVPLDSNNRRLVKAGFRRLRRRKCAPGLLALVRIARLNLSTLTISNISFDICPRLNAAGRLRLDDNPAAELLMTDDPGRAAELALKLDMCNRRRGDFERLALSEAREDAREQQGRAAIILYRPSWLLGIVGLLAGRIKDSYNVPCFVFSGDSDIISGSARSVPNFPVAAILQRVDSENPGLLIRYGGHAMAAGATIRRTDFARFKELFEAAARQLTGGPQEQEIVTDGQLPSNYLSLDFARELENAGPWGNGFPEPTFDGRFVIEKIALFAERHLRLVLSNPEDGSILRCVRLRASAREKQLLEGMSVQAVYALAVNRYSGSERLEIRIEALSPL